jgi:hypothetical protein
MTSGLGLILAAAALGQAAAAADGGVPAGARGGFVWDIPEVVHEVSVPGTLVSGGLPMSIRAVKSRWKADALLKKLAADFLRAGLWIPPPSAQPQILPLPYLAALDGRTLVSYSVFFQENRDGTTTLILGVAALERRGKSTPLAPVFPGGSSLLTSDVEGMRAMSYSVRAAPAEVQAFYRDVLGRGGYREAAPGRFLRGTETLSVDVKPQPGAGSGSGMVQVLVLLGPMVVAPELGGQGRSSGPSR